MFQRTFLTGLALTVLAVQACGSDDGKKKVTASDAGMGGEATPPGPDSGGSSAGMPVGSAGEPPTSVAGTAGAGGVGEPPIEPTAGAGGEPNPPVAPDPELLFSVKSGAHGLPNTAINAAGNEENFIYTSKTQSLDPMDGTNEVKITGAQLGLDAADQIVSFAILQAEPKNPTYLFSVADGSEGSSATRVYSAYWDDDQTEAGDLFYSDGVPSSRNLGEGGDQHGYNALSATFRSLGLSEGAEGDPDDLTGLAVHDVHVPITELYFTVRADAVGATDSAVATAEPDQRSCTVFKSSLDGQNSIAFSCAQLGLLPLDQIDALAVYGPTTPTEVVFSVNGSAQGAVGSAVETTQENGNVGATLFGSPGDGSNVVLKNDSDLGLGGNVNDEIDGIAVVDGPKTSVAHAASCSLAYDPLDPVAGGGLASISGTSHLAANVVVFFGQTATPTNRLIAYDATTCAFLQQHDMPVDFEDTLGLAIVPLAGWSATKPLDKVEYLRVGQDQAYGKELRRYDAAGVPATPLLISGTDYSGGIAALVHDPVGDRLYMLLTNGNYPPSLDFAVLPRPAADATGLTATFKHLVLPCADEAELTGTDAAGNLYLAKSQDNGFDYRICGFRPDGELLPAPYAWTSNLFGNHGGFIVPGGAHFLVHDGVTPIVIERGSR